MTDVLSISTDRSGATVVDGASVADGATVVDGASVAGVVPLVRVSSEGGAR